MKIKKILVPVLVLAIAVLTGCSQVNMGSSRSKTAATGSAAGGYSENVNPQLERCAEPLGTLAVNEDHSANWYSWLGRYGIQSTVPLLRLLSQQSNCFVVVERGAGLHSLQRERALQRSGELRKHSNFGKGQLVAADYTVTPTLIFSAHDTQGFGGAIGGLFGSVGALIGSNLKFSDAQSMLTLVDNRSGVQVAAAEGSADSMDIGGLMSMFETGLGVGTGVRAYSKTPEGKVIAASMTDAFNNLVRATKHYKPQKATGPHGLGTGGKLKVN
jgi:curli biogenesis system outer membrane secretion channel CsgG